jgi:OmpA-OmpF porin, OOP family
VRRVVIIGSIALSAVAALIFVVGLVSRSTPESEPSATGEPGAPVTAAGGSVAGSVPVATTPKPVEVATPVLAPVSSETVAAPAIEPSSDSIAPAVEDQDPGPSATPNVTVAPVVTVAVETPATTPAPDAVAESVGVVRNGQIFLSGAVPNVESGERIVALAAAILGPDNVINNYVIDPRATDPSLGNLTVEDTINFATDSTEILPGSETLLNQGLALLTVRPAMTVTIVGHTDTRGTDERNQELSLARAEMVRQWFVDRGISADRFAVQGAGSSQPLADNATADGRRINRRIQFFLENLLVEE